ncbi:ABC transporter permease [Gracilibacillus marinus]|uniref:ABC transporter permease n=1 Tax=Gracilibacillus marinus TaxID=630535 RepID=A0ABV8VVY5_9BACI
MNIRDQWRFVSKNMKKSKSRVFMTILATAMGVTFLIVLASVAFGLHDTLIKQHLENNTVTKIEVYGYESDDTFRSITDEDIQTFEALDGVKAVTRRVELYQSPLFTINDYSAHSSTIVTHFPSEIASGLQLSEGELPTKDNEIVVGHDFVKNLAPINVAEEEIYDENYDIKEEYQYTESLVGKEIDMTVSSTVDDEEVTKTFPVTISGVIESPSRDWLTDNSVYISDAMLKEIEAFTNSPRGEMEPQGEGTEEMSGYTSVYVYANSLEEVEGISEALKDDNYLVYSVADEMKQINMIFTIIKAGLIFIGTIAILIASIGIYNTMTMAVTERTPDIGIMKALGAHPKQIKQIFLLESSFIGLFGALVGTIVAYLISIIVNIGIPMILESVFSEKLPEGFQFSSIPLTLVLISTVICFLVTILSGLKPARKATRIDVLKALRREI